MTVTGGTNNAGIMGWPVDHSLSPAIHNFWMTEHGIDGSYIPLPIKPDALAEAVTGLAAMGFAGVNLTIPHKEAVLPFLDDISTEASAIGAVNTVVVKADGTLFGTNTDGFGFRAAIEEQAPAGWSPAGGRAVVLGAGGAARAIIYSLRNWGVEDIAIVNRTRARADALADEFGEPCRVFDWDSRADGLEGAALLVNTTRCGMREAPALDLALDKLPETALVNDIVYAPLITPLLAEARQRGNIVIDGLGMLLHQARPAFNAWFDVDPRVTPALRKRVLDGAGEG